MFTIIKRKIIHTWLIIAGNCTTNFYKQNMSILGGKSAGRRFGLKNNIFSIDLWRFFTVE